MLLDLYVDIFVWTHCFGGLNSQDFRVPGQYIHTNIYPYKSTDL